MGVFAEIDSNGICVALLETSQNMASASMITVADYDPALIGKRWDGAAFGLPVPASLLEAKAARTQALRDYFEAIVSAVKADAAPYEIATWETQRTEYMAWEANNASPTPYVAGLASARGMTIPDLMAKIAAKVTAFAALQGTQHALETAINAATTQDELDAIQW
ncbi:MAG: hypothetical protein K8H84_07355 [Sulfuricella denitrificans]|nr:hypothetical protein [Sulfuricella denitrificans]